MKKLLLLLLLPVYSVGQPNLKEISYNESPLIVNGLETVSQTMAAFSVASLSLAHITNDKKYISTSIGFISAGIITYYGKILYQVVHKTVYNKRNKKKNSVY